MNCRITREKPVSQGGKERTPGGGLGWKAGKKGQRKVDGQRAEATNLPRSVFANREAGPAFAISRMMAL